MPNDFFDALSAGDRIVVRYRLGGPETGPRFSDVLGTYAGLASPAGPTAACAAGEGAGAADSLVVVHTRSGEVLVPRGSVTHAKRVPPAPDRRRSRA